ncbi:uncharacterized protein LOC127005708 isoform X2 [Eriocheir sinensis]|uniref:uncharacterized protein LOC127005708 isoform X2 n=1 Tax=Eriocheir sinensis TaxID=95602 RepID=UPI0021C92E0F|nr:uncharacterized protein LOC127005708 isoform X2 [Eriocheir sinensis]
MTRRDPRDVTRLRSFGSTDVYLHTFLVGLVEVPALLCLWPAITCLGRRRTLSFLLAVCATSMAAVTLLIATRKGGTSEGEKLPWAPGALCSLAALVGAALVFLLPETTDRKITQRDDCRDDSPDHDTPLEALRGKALA